MTERADLRIEAPCPHRGSHDDAGRVLDGFKRHPLGEHIGYNLGGGKRYAEWCNGPTELTPAEVLSVLLPDVDWEALREAAATHERVMMYGAADYLTQRSPIWLAARRLLAVYDGKDG